MKKIITIYFSLILIFILASCGNNRIYSLKQASGFEISNILDVKITNSYYQSTPYQIPEEGYIYFDCNYIKVNYDIEKEIVTKMIHSKGDIYCLNIDIKDVGAYIENGAVFYINNNYMYFDGIKGTYRSNSKVPSEFFEMMKLTNGDNIMDKTIELKIDNKIVDVTWLDNDSVNALKELAKEGLSIDLEMYGGNEQFGSLGIVINSNDINQTAIAGDIMLYQSDKIVLFYGSNSWSYTKLGHINLSSTELTNLLGNKNVTISLFIK